MKGHSLLVVAALLLLLGPLPLPADPPSSAGVSSNASTLLITGAVEHPLTLSPSDLSQMPRSQLTARDKNDLETQFGGVALFELVSRAKPLLTKHCCSNAVNAIVIVGAADGYRVIFSLPEIDPEFTANRVLLADRREDQPMRAPEGPLRLVVPDEKSYARWVRQVTSIELRIIGPTNSPTR